MSEHKKLLIGEEVPRGEEHRVPAQTRQEDRIQVRRFAFRVLIFLVPLFLFFLVVEMLLWRVGETWPLEKVIHAQEINPRAVFGREVIDDGTFRYKYLQVLRRRPEILVLGSSRVMQFRAEMFGRQASVFYNAGGMTHSVQDLNDFIDQLPNDATPKVAILGTDFWWLNGHKKKSPGDSFALGSEWDGARHWQDHAYIFSGYLHVGGRANFERRMPRPPSLRKLVTAAIARKRHPDAIGLRALSRRAYRVDGSRLFKMNIPKTPEGWTQWIGGLEKIAENDIQNADDHTIFAPANGVSAELAEQLRTALLKLKARGVFVIGYNPPVIAECAQLAAEVPGQREYWKQYREIVPEIFKSAGFPFFDVETPKELGLDDRYMRDPYHPYDTFDMALLKHFCEDERIQVVFPDVTSVADKSLGSPRTNPLYLDLGDEGSGPDRN